MTASDVGYDRIHPWVKRVLGATHATVVVTITWAVLCLLLAHQATPAALARAVPAEQAGSGRSCLRRVRRWWAGPPLVLSQHPRDGGGTSDDGLGRRV
jgi:hypothetical protein